MKSWQLAHRFSNDGVGEDLNKKKILVKQLCSFLLYQMHGLESSLSDDNPNAVAASRFNE